MDGSESAFLSASGVNSLIIEDKCGLGGNSSFHAKRFPAKTSVVQQTRHNTGQERSVSSPYMKHAFLERGARWVRAGEETAKDGRKVITNDLLVVVVHNHVELLLSAGAFQISHWNNGDIQLLLTNDAVLPDRLLVGLSTQFRD